MLHLSADHPPIYIDPNTIGTWPVYDGRIRCYFSMLRYDCGHSTFDHRYPEINHHPFCGPRDHGRVVCRNAFHSDANTVVVSTTLQPGFCQNCNDYPPSVPSTTLLDSDSDSDADSDSSSDKVDGYMTLDPADGFIPENAEADLAAKLLLTASRFKHLGENLQENLESGLHVGVLQEVYKEIADNIVEADDLSQLIHDTIGKVMGHVRGLESLTMPLIPDGSAPPHVVRDRGGEEE